MSVTLHVEPGPSACCVVRTVLLPILTRSTVIGSEQVSELCNITVHCSVADDPSTTTLSLSVTDGEGTVEMKQYN